MRIAGLFFCTLLSLGYFSSEAQPDTVTQPVHYKCDTSGNLFLRDVNPIIRRVQSSRPDVFFHLYEGAGESIAGYSFLYWQKKGSVGNKLFGQNAVGSEFDQGFEIDNSFLKYINVDSLQSIFIRIASRSAPAGYRVPHDHLLYLEIFSGGRHDSYRMCESQLALYPDQEAIYYFRRILSVLRGRAG